MESTMAEDKVQGLTVTVAPTAICLILAYADGSQVQLTMPKPAGLEAQTAEQIETVARRMARRVLGVAMEDLSGR
jgi:hypothetical protein